MSTSTYFASEEKCSRCGSPLVPANPRCPTCNLDVGAPNCRIRGNPETRAALALRFAECMAGASNEEKKCLQAFKLAVETRSGVVVTIDPHFARKFLSDFRQYYNNIHELTENEIRKPPPPEHQSQRILVDGVLFPGYHHGINHGVLSLTNCGLRTYGIFHMRLRDIAIRDRVTFLENNSFIINRDNRSNELNIHAVWENRGELATAKLKERIKNCEPNLQSWQEILVYCHGSDRWKDDFIEAHVYEKFDGRAVEEVEIDNSAKGEEMRDAKLAVIAFKRTRAPI